MGQLFIGARHLHLPVLTMAPLFHGFLVLEHASAIQPVFSGDNASRAKRPKAQQKPRPVRSP